MTIIFPTKPSEAILATAFFDEFHRTFVDIHFYINERIVDDFYLLT